MIFLKITYGYVIQEFDNAGECTGQSFVAGDLVEYESSGQPLNYNDGPLSGREYQPFDMVQPKGYHANIN